MASLARSGRRSSRIATCTIVESGQEQRFYTMDFGRFNPQHALKRAITYGRETGISATQAMARLTMDQPEFAEKPGGPRCILDGLGSELTEALFQISSACPAVAAHITCNADLGITEVAYYPLWLERSQSQAPMQPQNVKNAGYYGHTVYVVCLPEERTGKNYEPSEETEHAQGLR